MNFGYIAKWRADVEFREMKGRSLAVFSRGAAPAYIAWFTEWKMRRPVYNHYLAFIRLGKDGSPRVFLRGM